MSKSDITLSTLKQPIAESQPSTVRHSRWLDACCIASIVGIWPRFIEPRLVTTNVVTLKVKDLPPALNGLKILHFSDLHLHRNVSDKFLAKLCRKARAWSPDIVAFTGDFICHSQLDDKVRLQAFLRDFPEGKYGSYAVLGNHDYAESVSVNGNGEYAVFKRGGSPLKNGIKRLFTRTRTPVAMQLAVRDIPLHKELPALLKTTPFKLLHNETKLIHVGDSALNICGLGEYLLGRFDPVKAFTNWDANYPGIILAHNPDCAPLLADYPGSVVLSGHTHGGQVNLFGLANTFMMIEHPQLRRGLVHVHDKWVSVSRGVGGILPFRWFAPPELLCLTLKSA
jgi:predicted MPP superfamily phosphohydrolase